MAQAAQEVIEAMPDAVVVVDAHGHIVQANAAVRGLLGWRPEELVGEPLDTLVPAELREPHRRHVARYRQRGRAATSGAMGPQPVLQALHRAGHAVPVSISIANLDVAGEPMSMAVVRNASQVHEELGAATALAGTDPLTGLANRRALVRAIDASIAADRPFGLLFLDLQRFKALNDRHGHAVGDAVLREVAQRICPELRRGDTAARYGGDEFVVLLESLHDPAHLAHRGEQLAAAIARPMPLADGALEVGVNVGGALYPGDGASAAALLDVADRRMYRAKRAGDSFFAPPDLG